MEVLYLFLAGAFGALIKDIVVDGKIELPKKIDAAIALGFIGGVLVGGFIGWVVDGSLITAALAGFTGTSVIENLIKREFKT